MANPSQIAAFVQGLPERQKSGTLRIWGQWFGRPMDNVHTCVASQSTESQLIMKFDQGETLTIWNPSEGMVVGATLSFASASRVKWEWYYYGRDHTPENLLSLEYEVEDGKIMRRSNFNRAAAKARRLLPRTLGVPHASCTVAVTSGFALLRSWKWEFNLRRLKLRH